MVVEFDSEPMLGDRADPHELPSNHNVFSAAMRRVPDAERPQPQQRRGAWRGGIGRLDIQHVDKSFADCPAVRGASLYVERGEAVTLLGPNGAGKTTIFYMITGLTPVDGGQVELEGHDITKLPMYQRARLGIGYLPQNASIYCELNVEQSIRVVLEAIEPDRQQREYDLEALLDELDIVRLRKTPSNALSSGDRRRVEIARALAARPSYLLLDEPFADVEPTAVDDMLALVRHVTQRGVGVLIADQFNQNSRQLLDVSDRAYVICLGDILGTLVA
ncbi:LPS export ABC transporter ATP-binding protein [Bradyrhizobium sp.]|uniref:LPS export ABC transporter ATP-binding protein n=1 Tax=Bradyrhizobium sp. TaxID=376 RepID=UPI001ED79DA0|nr:LPS export ABC transporter ATP-binding protein [Bradyrhizobium sp.]MBV9982469.1 LPS export ABC transporter ATP-binding protein [Bradyrhizobium sp.]